MRAAIAVWLLVALLGLFTLPRGVLVLVVVEGLRWSFRNRDVAVVFASDNEATVETKDPPQRRDDAHDSDGVDQTGLHGDSDGND